MSVIQEYALADRIASSFDSLIGSPSLVRRIGVLLRLRTCSRQSNAMTLIGSVTRTAGYG